MDPLGVSILESLREVGAERGRRASFPVVAARSIAVKAWQHARFQRTYADLLADRRYGAAARFFLEDLYGPADFTRRDVEFARIVPALCHMLPREVLLTVRELAELHAISERLDSQMALAIEDGELSEVSYAAAWRKVGHRAERSRQIALMASVGNALDVYTRNPMLRSSLRLMRGPARIAGLGNLQRFLEAGFDAFRSMGGADYFLRTIAAREAAEAAQLFSDPPVGDPKVEGPDLAIGPLPDK